MSKIAWTDEAHGRKLGALKTAAKRIGIGLDEYLARRRDGMKHCRSCRTWLHLRCFAVDASRGDGLSARCRACASQQSKDSYTPRPRVSRRGMVLVPARDGDKRQARRRVNHLVETGRVPHPNTMPCVDCGHRWAEGERRHEYDHYNGYAAEHHLDVQAVCTTCHHRRERERCK